MLIESGCSKDLEITREDPLVFRKGADRVVVATDAERRALRDLLLAKLRAELHKMIAPKIGRHRRGVEHIFRRFKRVLSVVAGHADTRSCSLDKEIGALREHRLELRLRNELVGIDRLLVLYQRRERRINSSLRRITIFECTDKR